MNSLLQRMRQLNIGGSLHGIFAGSAIHADDIRCIAPSVDSTIAQSSEINSFTTDVGLKLNTSKLEIIQLSQTPTEPLQITLGGNTISTKRSASCLGVQWLCNLSAKESVNANIAKARKAFFALGSTRVFHGDLNPLSSSNIFETCVLSVLLYGCETWLLDASCIQALERFQCEIGRRILKLSKFHANEAVRIGLHWPTMSTRILLRKLSFMSKLLSNKSDSMSSRIFNLLLSMMFTTSLWYNSARCLRLLLQQMSSTNACHPLTMLRRLCETARSYYSTKAIRYYCLPPCPILQCTQLL